MHHPGYTRQTPASSFFKRLKEPATLAALLCFGLTVAAQTHVPRHGVSQPASAAQNGLNSQPAEPPKTTSLLEQPPTAATINATAEHLSVHAENASLTQTLQRIADKTGMHIEGLSIDQRVFGTFGPGAPRDVLNALLDGTGYNVIMVGSLDNGAPRQLILSQAKSGNAPQAQSAQPAQPASSDDDSNPDGSSDDQLPTPPQTFTPPPGSDQAPPPNRTPQQMLQQLQEMRQQQTPPQ